jgi:adenine/guanine/hypoxanthine permease
VSSVYFRPCSDRFFNLSAHRTTIRTEVLAGLTTFLTMADIIFVQPTVLSAAGMDFGAVMIATCLASAVATLLMGLLPTTPSPLPRRSGTTSISRLPS